MKDIWRRFDEVVTGVLLAVLVVVVALQVVFRYALYQPMGWTEEAGRYAFIWLSLSGAAVAVRRGAHIGVDLVIRNLPAGYARGVQILIDALAALFCGGLAFLGVLLVLFTAGQTSPGLMVPMSVPYLALPLGGGLMAIYLIQRVWRSFTRSEG